jgi:hypothetical protein
LTKNQKIGKQTRDQIEVLILEAAKKQKPETTQQLIATVQERCALKEEEITKILMELEKENRLRFNKQEPQPPASARGHLFSWRAAWYWTTIALATATAITVFTVPEKAYPMVYLRSALSVIFVLYLPGYAFIKALFPSKIPMKTSSEDPDTIEQIALSLGMSLALVPIVGLILNYTPWGITLTPITLSLLALTVVFATVAILRKPQASAT